MFLPCVGGVPNLTECVGHRERLTHMQPLMLRICFCTCCVLNGLS